MKKKKRRKLKHLTCFRGEDSSDEFENIEDTKAKRDGNLKVEAEGYSILHPNVLVNDSPIHTDVHSSNSCVVKQTKYALQKEKKTKKKELSSGKSLQKYIKKITSKKLPKEKKTESKSLYEAIREIAARHIFFYRIDHFHNNESMEFSLLEKSVQVKGVQTRISSCCSADGTKLEYESSANKDLISKRPRAKDLFKFVRGQKEENSRLDKLIGLERQLQDMERKVVDSSLSTNPGASVTIEVGTINILVENLPTGATTCTGSPTINKRVVKPECSNGTDTPSTGREAQLRKEMCEFYKRERQKFARCTRPKVPASEDLISRKPEQCSEELENGYNISMDSYMNDLFKLEQEFSFANESAPSQPQIKPDIKEPAVATCPSSETTLAFLKQTTATINGMPTCEVALTVPEVSTSLHIPVVQSVEGLSEPTPRSDQQQYADVEPIVEQLSITSLVFVPTEQDQETSPITVVPSPERLSVQKSSSVQEPSPVAIVLKEQFVPKSPVDKVQSVQESLQTPSVVVVKSAKSLSSVVPKVQEQSVPKSSVDIVSSPTTRDAVVLNVKELVVLSQNDSSVLKAPFAVEPSVKESSNPKSSAVVQSVKEPSVKKSQAFGSVNPAIEGPSIPRVLPTVVMPEVLEPSVPTPAQRATLPAAPKQLIVKSESDAPEPNVQEHKAQIMTAAVLSEDKGPLLNQENPDLGTGEDVSMKSNTWNQQLSENTQSCLESQASRASENSGTQTDSDGNSAPAASDISVQYESSGSSESDTGTSAALEVSDTKNIDQKDTPKLLPKHTPNLPLEVESVRKVPADQNSLKSVKVAATVCSGRAGYNQTLIVDRQLDSSSESEDAPKLPTKFTTRKVDNKNDDLQLNTTSDSETSSSEYSSSQSEQLNQQQHEKVQFDVKKGGNTQECSKSLSQNQPPSKVDEGILFGCKFSSRAQEALAFQTSKSRLGAASLVLKPIGTPETGGKDSSVKTENSKETNLLNIATKNEKGENDLKANRSSGMCSQSNLRSDSTKTQIPKQPLHQKPLLDKRRGDQRQNKLNMTGTDLQPPSAADNRKIGNDDNIFGCKFSSRAQESLASMRSKPRLRGSSLVLQSIGKSEPPAKAVNKGAQAIFKAELEISQTQHPDQTSRLSSKKKSKKKLQQLSGSSETAFQKCTRDEIRNTEKELLQRRQAPISNPLFRNDDLIRGPKGGFATGSLPPPRGPSDLLAPSPFKKKSGKSLAPVRNKSGDFPMPKSQAIHHPQFMDPTSAFPEKYLAAPQGYPVPAVDPAMMDSFLEMDPYELISQQYAAAMDAHQYAAAMNAQQYAAPTDARPMYAALDPPLMHPYPAADPIGGIPYPHPEMMGQYTGLDPTFSPIQRQSGFNNHMMGPVDPICGIPYPYPGDYPHPEMMGQYTGLDPTFSPIQRQSGFNDHMMGPVDPICGIPYPYPDDYPHPEMMGQYIGMDPTFSPVQRQSGFNDHLMMGHMMPQSHHDNKGRLRKRGKISSGSLNPSFPPHF